MPQFLKEKGNEAKVKHDIDVIETINIELEHRVATLLKENETLKRHYKEMFDSIKTTRAKNIEHTTSLIATNDKFKAQLQEKGFAVAALKNELRKLTGNSVNTKFTKPSILGKPVGQPLKNQSISQTNVKSEQALNVVSTHLSTGSSSSLQWKDSEFGFEKEDIAENKALKDFDLMNTEKNVDPQQILLELRNSRPQLRTFNSKLVPKVFPLAVRHYITTRVGITIPPSYSNAEDNRIKKKCMDKGSKERSPPHNLRQKPGQYICYQNHKMIAGIENDIMDPVMQCTTSHPSSGSLTKLDSSFVTEIHTLSIDISLRDCSQAVIKSPTQYHCDICQNIQIQSETLYDQQVTKWKSFQCHHQTALRSVINELTSGEIVSLNFIESIKEARSRVQDLTSGEIVSLNFIESIKEARSRVQDLTSGEIVSLNLLSRTRKLGHSTMELRSLIRKAGVDLGGNAWKEPHKGSSSTLVEVKGASLVSWTCEKEAISGSEL
ncbi:hypothetical protein Tco_0641132 [Tanacetum coccineum]